MRMVMRTAGILLGLVFSILGSGSEFFANGRPDSSGWVWLRMGNGLAQWQFYDIAWEGQFLNVELVLQTRGWQIPPPISLTIALQFSTFGASLTRRVCLQRVAEASGVIQYFGQVVIARRDLKFGSYLCIQLSEAPLGVEVGVHPSSLRILGEHTGYLGQGSAGGVGGPLVASPPKDGGKGEAVVFPAASTVERKLRECVGMEDAPYVSPGRYLGELGWPGPGSSVDCRDWLRVNLNTGHVLEVLINTPRTVNLWLLNPWGQEVGRVSGFGKIGLTYQATARGVYWVCISVTESPPSFTYTLDLSIHR
ncbi:MAG: hypothetical protein NZ651_00185 [Candidatus Bipolaricaulota bacterium]|nr:hypothetical protein [Candidatus Bipolaricaulota bacterium]MDW8126189.1 hypothetical protein [Candidatus Bipolaricaulota bacterium]